MKWQHSKIAEELWFEHREQLLGCPIRFTAGQAWAINGPRVTPQRFRWPADAFRKMSNLKFFENCVRLHLSHWIVCAR